MNKRSEAVVRIPLIVGIISTAEERNLGLLDWQLTLPPTANRQWFVKVFATFTVNVILGLVLPLSLVGISASWFGMGSFQPQRADEYTPFLIANLAIFCAAIYASSASGNNLRALVGTIVICAAVPMLIFPSVREVFNISITLAGPLKLHWLGWKEGKLLSQAAMWLGGSAFGLWLYLIGLMNYRHSLGSIWRPIRQISVLVAVSILYLGTVAIFVLMAGP